MHAIATLVMLAALIAAAGCDAADGAARARYNQALSDYEQGRWEAAAEGFLEARNQAGQDSELRYRAAFNLGLTHARQADDAGQGGGQEAGQAAGPGPGQDIEKQIEQLRRSAAWFRDAVRLRPEGGGGKDDARVNLEVVLRRIQVLADQLNKGKNSLEARLDRVIEDQRGLRDRVRALMERVAASGSAAEPVAFQKDFDELAKEQRMLLADTGTVSDLAGEEMGLVQGKPEEERTQEEQVRLVQLQNMDHYLQQARGSLADTRRLLRRLQGASAHRRADAGLAELKRAREQLLDPVTVLKGIAQDQTLLLMHTGALEQLGKGSLSVSPDGDGADDGDQAAPAWLTAAHLNERQTVIGQRTSEVLARFQAAAAAALSGPDGAAPASEDPKQQRMLIAAGEAVPFLEQAVAAMNGAATALAGERLSEAAARQTEALEALFAAIERFSGIRDLIELTYGDHAQTLGLLTPPEDVDSGAAGDAAVRAAAEAARALPADERLARVRTLATRDLDRVRRLQGLIDDELASLDAQAAQAQQGAAPGGQPGMAPAQSPEEIEGMRQQYQQAQALRQQAEDALARLGNAVPAAGAARADEARAAAGEAMEHIEALRRLFYSIIEHLKELHENQTDTHDRTASGSGTEGEELAAHLGPLVDAQRGHAALGDALAQALAEQADAAAAAPQQGGQDAQQAAERMAQAAQEVREATAQMQGAADFMAKDVDDAKVMSVDVTPTLDAQQAAMEHLAEAIRLLQPPQQQNQDQQDQQDQQEQQDQQQQQEQQQEVSRQQAQRRLQEIRDREAERQRDKRRQQRFTPEPVEKDW